MKTERKIYLAPECQVIQVAITTPILAMSASSTAESITIDDNAFVW